MLSLRPFRPFPAPVNVCRASGCFVSRGPRHGQDWQTRWFLRASSSPHVARAPFPTCILGPEFFSFFCLFPALLFVRSVVAVNISTPVSARLSHSVSSARKAGGSSFPGSQMGTLANIWPFTLSKESRWWKFGGPGYFHFPKDKFVNESPDNT